VHAEAAGEQAITDGDVNKHTRSGASGAKRARNQVGPRVDVVACVAGDRGLACRARRGVNARDLLLGYCEHPVPELRNDFSSDSAKCSKFWDLGQRLRAKIPAGAARNANDAAASEFLRRKERDLRERFLSLHVEELYSKLTARGSTFLRLERPRGLCPD
jgi:hypothetical protein